MGEFSRCYSVLGLSQRAYIEKMLKKYNLDKCNTSPVPLQKGDKPNGSQCPKNDFERSKMRNIPYASAVGSLMYAQVCMRPDLAFTAGVLSRYHTNLG